MYSTTYNTSHAPTPTHPTHTYTYIYTHTTYTHTHTTHTYTHTYAKHTYIHVYHPPPTQILLDTEINRFKTKPQNINWHDVDEIISETRIHTDGPTGPGGPATKSDEDVVGAGVVVGSPGIDKNRHCPGLAW